MTSGAPDAVILLVGGNAGLIGMSKEHLAIALALGVPVCVVISKVRPDGGKKKKIDYSLFDLRRLT